MQDYRNGLKALRVSMVAEGVLLVELNRPKKMNVSVDDEEDDDGG